MRRFSLIVLLLLAAGLVPAGAATPLTWESLKDPAAAFEDPFEALTPQDLRSLGEVLRLRQRLEQPDVAEEARPRIEQRLQQQEAMLAAAGVETDRLLSQRLEIGRKRVAAGLAGNPAVTGREVAITGYVIPVAGPGGDGVTAGYLVPEAGMCSHMPAPDPNQMIRYRLSTDWQADHVYEPVLLTGTLSLKTTRQEIMLLDGQVEMIAAFEMTVTGARSLSEPERPSAAGRLWNLFRRPARDPGQ